MFVTQFSIAFGQNLFNLLAMYFLFLIVVLLGCDVHPSGIGFNTGGGGADVVLKDSCGVLCTQVWKIPRIHSSFIFFLLFPSGFAVATSWEGWLRLLYPQPESPAPPGESPDISELAVRYNLSRESWVCLPRGLHPVEPACSTTWQLSRDLSMSRVKQGDHGVKQNATLKGVFPPHTLKKKIIKN